MDNKKRNILLGILIVGVVSMTVAFAALSTNLSINGTASLPATSWNIHFANGVDNTSGTHASGKTNRGTITGLQFAATSISNFTATLYQPNDEVVYNFDIVNEGTIAGQLDNFTKTLTCNSANCDMITYTITCEDASHNDANQSDYILASGASVSCEMKIKYNDQTNSNNGVYSQGAVSATATATWLYKQVEGSNNSGGNSGNQGGNEQGQGGNSGSGDFTYYGFGWSQDPLIRNATQEEIENEYCQSEEYLYYLEYDSETNKCIYCPEGYEFSDSKCTTMNFEEGKNTIYSDSYMWIQENNTTGVKELCGKADDNTICFNPSQWEYEEEYIWNEQTEEYETQINANEYTTAKLNELTTKGFECGGGNSYFSCDRNGGLALSISSDGSGYAVGMDHSHYGETCTLLSSGNYYCNLD